ncbi:MAG: hypothetical protein V4563_13230 [Pseudomonadota bacterium]
MVNLAPALSIADLASEWFKETGEAKLECALARAFINGKLMVSDPEMDRWCCPFLDDVEIEVFLQANKNYSEHYYASGDGVIFNNEYWLALDEIAYYGKAVTVHPKMAEMALSNLFVIKKDFRKWLHDSNKKMPAFWQSESDLRSGIRSEVRLSRLPR